MPLLSVAAIALPLIGTGLEMAGNAQSQSAMNQARANEVAQQAALQKKNDALLQTSMSASTPATAANQMQTGQNSRNSIWSSLQGATVPEASALPATGSTPTTAAQKRAGGAAATWNQLNANAAAKEGSYGDWQNQLAINNSDTAAKMGTNANFAQQDAALLPTELQVASQAGDQLSGWGTILGALGGLAGAAGKSGMFASNPSVANSVTEGTGNLAGGSSLYMGSVAPQQPIYAFN